MMGWFFAMILTGSTQDFGPIGPFKTQLACERKLAIYRTDPKLQDFTETPCVRQRIKHEN